MKDVILDTVLDSLKLLPFLFVAFLIIELIEHKVNNKKIMVKTKKLGPLAGGILGIIPQCGFSSLATNLYVARIISLGTLISIYLSTSDEMLPILISEGTNISLIIEIIIIKLVIGILAGFIIDLILKKQESLTTEICNNEHCHCEKSLLKSSLKHTINIFVFIFIISFIINILFFYLGEENLAKIFMKDNIFSPFISSLIGLIPNCASSVAITTFYLNSTINFGSMIAGLLTGSGTALMVLFKTNKNIKENLKIVGIIYLIGSVCGMIINLVG